MPGGENVNTMLGNRKLIIDDHCEVYKELLPWADAEFYDISQQQIVPGGIYVVCREQVNKRSEEIIDLAQRGDVTVVIDNAAEGSETLVTWCFVRGIVNLIEQRKILLIGGGDMDPVKWPYMSYEYFLPKIFDFDINVGTASQMDNFFTIKNKPYKFLFLNGRLRSHRKYLLERFKSNNLLQQSLWTNLDTNSMLVNTLPQTRWLDFNDMDMIKLELIYDGVDLMDQPIDIHCLPTQYEFSDFREHIETDLSNFPGGNVKQKLFNNTWGDAVIDGSAFRDTYFSLVTETVFNYPYSFRTEKIWKPVAIGHPFIAVANSGFYRDLHNMGFKTFGHVIDESFDQIENSQDRIERIAAVVEDLCQQDLASFYTECYNVCKYNQQHYAEYRHRVPQEFPAQFQQFIEKYQ
jgi:hypothetical protein